jgi:hypothetical protein
MEVEAMSTDIRVGVPAERPQGSASRSRVRLWVLVGILLVLEMTTAWTYSRPKERNFNVSEFQQIRCGMTEREVEEVLGCPPGNYARLGPHPNPVDRPPEVSRGTGKVWVNDMIWIVVIFDNQGKVKRKGWAPVIRGSRSSFTLPFLIRLLLDVPDEEWPLVGSLHHSVGWSPPGLCQVCSSLRLLPPLDRA